MLLCLAYHQMSHGFCHHSIVFMNCYVTSQLVANVAGWCSSNIWLEVTWCTGCVALCAQVPLNEGVYFFIVY